MTTAALVEGLAAAKKCIIEKCKLGQWESIVYEIKYINISVETQGQLN